MVNPAAESLPKGSIASTEEALIHVLYVDDELDYLKTAKKICEAYSWTIRETGKPRKGAQFTITIPKMNKNGKTSYVIN